MTVQVCRSGDYKIFLSKLIPHDYFCLHIYSICFRNKIHLPLKSVSHSDVSLQVWLHFISIHSCSVAKQVKKILVHPKFEPRKYIYVEIKIHIILTYQKICAQKIKDVFHCGPVLWELKLTTSLSVNSDVFPSTCIKTNSDFFIAIPP